MNSTLIKKGIYIGIGVLLCLAYTTLQPHTNDWLDTIRMSDYNEFGESIRACKRTIECIDKLNWDIKHTGKVKRLNVTMDNDMNDILLDTGEFIFYESTRRLHNIDLTLNNRNQELVQLIGQEIEVFQKTFKKGDIKYTKLLINVIEPYTPIFSEMIQSYQNPNDIVRYSKRASLTNYNLLEQKLRYNNEIIGEGIEYIIPMNEHMLFTSNGFFYKGKSIKTSIVGEILTKELLNN